MSHTHQTLLDMVRLLKERQQSNQQSDFNIFSVLRSESDEVRLHSRFLGALLDYQQPYSKEKENLSAFLSHLGISGFSHEGAKVELEASNIDILVTSAENQQAIIIENKIYAGDQEHQLERYWQIMDSRGYKEIYIVYLTLDGREPSEQSIGKLGQVGLVGWVGQVKSNSQENISDQGIICCSYKDCIPPWLEDCQQRACTEPALRESISQYLQLIRKLTATDLSESYMKDLTELLLKNDNLLLAHDLKEAMTEAMIQLQLKLWSDIEEAIAEAIPNLPAKSEQWSYSLEYVNRFYKLSRNNRYFGLYYPLPDSAGYLSVEIENGIYFGVWCYSKDHPTDYEFLKEKLKDCAGTPTAWWPCYQHPSTSLNLRYPSRENLKLLGDDSARKAFAQDIADGLKAYWQQLGF